MVELVIETGDRLKYDAINNVVLVNGVKDKNWHPSFIENGNEEPDFFGFVNQRTKKCYDIYGGISKISSENDIKL